MDRFLQSKVCLADNWDLKKSNKRKQTSNGAVLLTAHFAIWSCWALWATRRKGSPWALFCLLSAPKQHWAVYDGAITTPCHPWESWRFNLPSSMKHSSVLLCWQLDFPYLLSAWFVFHSVHRHFDSLSGFWCNIYNVSIWDGYVRYFLNLNCISVGYFVFSVPKHLWLTNVCSTLERIRLSSPLISHNPPNTTVLSYGPA